MGIEKKQLIYELSELERTLLAYDGAEGPIPEFIGCHLVRNPGLMWADLENLLINEYVDEGTAIETMRSLMKLTQARDEMTRKLGARVMKLLTIAFSEEVRENATIHVQLADLIMDVLENDVIKEAPITLTVGIDLAKDSEKVWGK